MRSHTLKNLLPVLSAVGLLVALEATGAGQAAEPHRRAAEILAATGVRGGLVVHVGCGGGELTAALHATDSYLVHGLDTNAENVKRARAYIRSLNLYGPVSVDLLRSNRLPYIEGSVNLLVSGDLGGIPLSEVMRVLVPDGTAYLKRGGRWVKIMKQRPRELDEWSHYLHDSTNNAVSHDTRVAPPRRLQWVAPPRHGRHHDRMSSLNALVTAGGRVFYIMDEATRASILVPPKWTLAARDAFNGTLLWKRKIEKWFNHLWPLKSGPAQLPRRLVAAGDRVYVTLGIEAPLSCLDGATGKTLITYEGTKATEEILYSDGVLFLLVDPGAEDYVRPPRNAYGGKFWNERPRKVMAVNAETGEILWTVDTSILPATLAADSKRVFFHNGESVVCLGREKGNEIWRSEPVPRVGMIRSFYLPTLLVKDGVLLFSGGETAGNQTGSWYTKGKDTLTALSVEDGKELWKAYHPPSGYRSPEDTFVAGGLVWTGNTTSGRVRGEFTGRDLRTGEVKSRFASDVNIYWFHHRCYRGKATDRYLLTSRTGTEFIDFRNKHWIPNHWIRGSCLYGIMPANGLLYAPPHPCACYLEAKLVGFNALAPAGSGPRIPPESLKEERLEKGPAYGEKLSGDPAPGEWPVYRHDSERSGRASTAVPASLARAWKLELGGRLTSPVVAYGKVFVASVDAHTLYAVDARNGKPVWSFTAGGRIDSPPTAWKGRVFFGCADGRVYSLRASDGALAWSFLAAPMDQRLVGFEQVESVWPVHGSVLIREGVLYCVAGRSMFTDDGMRLWRLEAASGRPLSVTVLNDRDPETGKTLQDYVSWLNMPVADPDILSCDGRYVYMRSQGFNFDGTRLPLERIPRSADLDHGAPPPVQRPDRLHLFSPTGFLDDSWWHRTYWLYGSTFVSGWCGYFLAGRVVPAGRILVFDEKKVYAFGRKPRFYRWTTPIEHELFAAEKKAADPVSGTNSRGASVVRVPKSETLNPAGKPLTAEAWIKAERRSGVVLARGGGVQGYALYLRGGRPRFTVRIDGKAFTVEGKERVNGRWVHLAGVLTREGKMFLYVDGKEAAAGKASGLLTQDPAEILNIAADEGSCVGDYTSPSPFKGLIDEVKIYRRPLSPEEIALEAAGRKEAGAKTDLALWFAFEKGGAVDSSGNRNEGSVEGAMPTRGRVGRALRFRGTAPRGPQYLVDRLWTEDVPLLVRALLLSEGKLFCAGPPDLVDEEQAFKRINHPDVIRKLAEQEESLDGKRGGLLCVFSAEDGRELSRLKLENPPVFDGFAAAERRLFMTTTAGRLLCFAGRGE